MLHRLPIVTLLLVLADGARGDEPEVLPPPQNMPPAVQPAPVPHPGVIPYPVPILPYRPRLDTREVWQYYAVDSRGQFQPRVILSPAGGYYQSTLQPYPWVTSLPNRYLGYTIDGGGVMVPGR